MADTNIPDFNALLSEAKSKISLSKEDAKEFSNLVDKLVVVQKKLKDFDGELIGKTGTLLVKSLEDIKVFGGKIIVG